MSKLITSVEVIDLALLHDNVDPNLIKDSYIEVTQEEYILPTLTKDLYEQIVSQNTLDTLTSVNATLLNDYIKPALAFFVCVDIVDHLAIRTTNKGLMINSSETSNPATKEERSDIKTRYREQGQTMLDKLIRFIEHEDNNSDYPLYENGSSETITTKLKGGIIL